MKNPFLLACVATIALAAFASPASSAVLITNFGSGPTVDGVSDWSYTSLSSTLSGTSDAGGALSEAISSINIGTNNQLSLTARLTSSTLIDPDFSVSLFSGGGTATADFNFNDFSSANPVTQVAALVPGVGFDGSSVTQWFMTAGGSNAESFTIEFGSLSAVPEPSTIGLLLIGGGLSAFAMGRRRRHRA